MSVKPHRLDFIGAGIGVLALAAGFGVAIERGQLGVGAVLGLCAVTLTYAGCLARRRW